MFAGDIVIGSGPGGVAAAYGLLEKKRRVLLLDVGHTLEADRQRTLARYQSRPPEDWDEKLYELLRENTDPSVGRLPEKLVYSSRFSFEWKDSEVKVVQEGAEIVLSHAMGGLSNVWGANVLPFMPRDIADWPLPFSELEEGYRAVSAFMPIAAQADELTDLYLLYGGNRAGNAREPAGQEFVGGLAAC